MKKSTIITASVVLIIVLTWWKTGIYTIQPIGMLPEGKTLIVWRESGEPFFNSPDATCLERVGAVSLMCRMLAMSKAPVNRIILRLPYWEWSYLASTGGNKFEK